MTHGRSLSRVVLTLPFLLVVLLAWGHLTPAAAAPPRWHWSNPQPFGNNIADLVGDTNRFYLAVADHGQAYVSEDLASWRSLETGTRGYLRSAVFHRLGTDTNAVVVTGESGLVLRLDGSLNVSSTQLPTTDWLEGVASSGSRLVAVGDNAAIYTSDDGTNWLRRSAGFGVNTWLRSVAWRARSGGGGTFVAVGESGQVLTSTDGVSWTLRSSGTTQDLNRVVATPTGFIAVGAAGTALVTTSEGQRWTALATGATDDLFAIALETRTVFGQSVTVPLVAGANELRSGVASGGGFLWTDELDTRRTSPAPASTYYAAMNDGTRHVIGGRAGLVVTAQRKTGLDQSLLWSPFDTSSRAILWDVGTALSIRTNQVATLVDGQVSRTERVSTNTIYAAVGYGPTLLQSDNGITWTAALIPAAASNVVFLGVGGRPDHLVAVGSGGHVVYSPQAFEPLVTTNRFTNGAVVQTVVLTNQINTLGLAWRNATTGVTNDLQGIATDGSLFVATGANGTILTSPDALAWTRRSTPAARYLSGVEHGTTGWVAVGERGTVWTSSDATAWVARSSGTTNWLWQVRHVDDQCLAVGQNGTLLASTDGANWIPRATGVTNWLYDVGLVAGTYVAVGSQGVILTSADGLAWTVADTLTGKSLYGLAANGGQLVVVGSEGAILRAQFGAFPSAPQLIRWPTTPTDTLFLIQGHQDQRLRIDRSKDLLWWYPGMDVEITAQDGTLLLYDTTPNTADVEFFRAAERP